MQVIVTKIDEITSTKTGTPIKYIVLHAITESGESLSQIIGADRAAEWGVNASISASSDQVKQLFKELPVIEFEFNQRGRLEKIEV